MSKELESQSISDDERDVLPKGWEMRVSDEGGKVYYVDHNTRHTQWTHPKSGKELHLSPTLPFGWEKTKDDKGRTLYVNRVNDKSTCVDPRIAFALTETNKGKVKFDADTTALRILHGKDLGGKTALITGATSGIGFETALALAHHGCHVILACRSVERGREAAERITQRQSYRVTIDVVECDLESLTSVKKCAEYYISMKWKLDILVLNAGTLGLPYGVTEDGIERTFASNYLRHFYLTVLLKNLLIECAYSRVVVVSSESHRFPSLYDNIFDVSCLPMEEVDYVPMVAYNQSKLCCLIFALELNRRFSKFGVFANAVHPGNLMPTRITRHSYLYGLLHFVCRPFVKSPSQGAATTVYVATWPDLEGLGGYYFNNCAGCNPSAYASKEEQQHLVSQQQQQQQQQLFYYKRPPLHSCEKCLQWGGGFLSSRPIRNVWEFPYFPDWSRAP